MSDEEELPEITIDEDVPIPGVRKWADNYFRDAVLRLKNGQSSFFPDMTSTRLGTISATAQRHAMTHFGEDFVRRFTIRTTVEDYNGEKVKGARIWRGEDGPLKKQESAA